ncbi:hypothetical protein LINGRAHAP2_LOCUS8273, partial [Linum grandiflorum]
GTEVEVSLWSEHSAIIDAETIVFDDMISPAVVAFSTLRINLFDGRSSPIPLFRTLPYQFSRYHRLSSQGNQLHQRTPASRVFLHLDRLPLTQLRQRLALLLAAVKRERLAVDAGDSSGAWYQSRILAAPDGRLAFTIVIDDPRCFRLSIKYTHFIPPAGFDLHHIVAAEVVRPILSILTAVIQRMPIGIYGFRPDHSLCAFQFTRLIHVYPCCTLYSAYIRFFRFGKHWGFADHLCAIHAAIPQHLQPVCFVPITYFLFPYC